MFGLCDPLDPPCHCPIRASYQYISLLFHYPLTPSSSVDVINGSPLTAPSMEGVTSGNNFWAGKRRSFASSLVADTNRTFLLFLLDRRTRTDRKELDRTPAQNVINQRTYECGVRTRADADTRSGRWCRKECVTKM